MADPGRLWKVRHARLQRAWRSSHANFDTVSRMAAAPIGVMARPRRERTTTHRFRAHRVLGHARTCALRLVNVPICRAMQGGYVEVVSHVGALPQCLPDHPCENLPWQHLWNGVPSSASWGHRPLDSIIGRRGPRWLCQRTTFARFPRVGCVTDRQPSSQPPIAIAVMLDPIVYWFW